MRRVAVLKETLDQRIAVTKERVELPLAGPLQHIEEVNHLWQPVTIPHRAGTTRNPLTIDLGVRWDGQGFDLSFESWIDVLRQTLVVSRVVEPLAILVSDDNQSPTVNLLLADEVSLVIPLLQEAGVLSDGLVGEVSQHGSLHFGDVLRVVTVLVAARPSSQRTGIHLRVATRLRRGFDREAPERWRHGLDGPIL